MERGVHGMSMDWKESERPGGEPERKSFLSPRIIALVIVAVLILVFILQNTDKTTVHFLFFDLTAGKWFALVVAVALGVLLDRAFMWWWRRRKTATARS
jgi:uncharacterized integral membrane protein